MFFNIFNRKKSVTVALDKNVKLMVVPAVAGGVHATIVETCEFCDRHERMYFLNLNDLIHSLRTTDESIIRKLSKAF